MNLHALRLLLLATALVLPGCVGAPIALVDANYGHEYVIARRAAHIESMRVVIEEPVVGTDQVPVHRFTLRIGLDNRNDATWVVGHKDLSFEVCPCSDKCPDGVTVQLAFKADVLVTLAAHSSATLTVPIDIRIPPSTQLHELEHLLIDIHLRDGESDLLHRRLAIGVFNQLGQAVRLAAVFTAALLLVAVI